MTFFNKEKGFHRKMKVFISKIANGLSLSQSEAEEAFGIIMSGDATPSQMGAFLMGLRIRGETIEEITGAARAMRKKSKNTKKLVTIVMVDMEAQQLLN